jgi:Rod binding domain-containing protein
MEMNKLMNSDMSVNGLNKKRSGSDKNNTYIEVKKFSAKEEKFFSQNMLKSMKTYIEKFVQNTHTRWQVARGLVTTMIEVIIFSNFALQYTT